MPIIQVSILAGRTHEQRSRFVTGVVDSAVEHLGVTASQVRVLVTEVPPENWYTAGIAKLPPQTSADDTSP